MIDILHTCLLYTSSAGDRELLVKKYSRERFSREKLNRIESALQRQAMLEAYGVACPHVYRCGQKIIRFLDDGTAYMVMSFCQGKNENAQTINTAQMKSLGSACGYLHKAFSRLTGSVEKSFPAFGGYTKDSLGQTPVSYTHIDVYKRQPLYWAIKTVPPIVTPMQTELRCV